MCERFTVICIPGPDSEPDHCGNWFVHDTVTDTYEEFPDRSAAYQAARERNAAQGQSDTAAEGADDAP